MKRIVCLIVVVLTLWSLACPVYAARNNFVPSIGEKPGPEIKDAVLDGEDVDDCIIVSSIEDCREKTTDIGQDDRDLLLLVYEQLRDGEMELPLENDYVIRELVDVSFREDGCVKPDHGHEEELKENDTTIKITFDLGIDRDVEVVVLVYADGEWKPIVDVIVNDDGSVICEFEDICPVVFCVDPESDVEPPKTGDTMGAGLLLWIAVLAVSAASALVLLRYRKKILG